MTNDMTVNAQWSSRPDDQRYLTVQSLHDAVQARRDNSREVGTALEHLSIAPTDDGAMLLTDGRSDAAGLLTHHAFGKVCRHIGAPAPYLRTLPASLAALPLQWSMENANREDGKLLLRRTATGINVADLSTTTYGRIYDAQITSQLVRLVEGTNTWKVPGASYASKDAKRATTLYASDHDMFAFLVDETRPIEAKGGELLYRGFYTWNSEVGTASFGLASFLYRYVCDNRIIWGQEGYREIRIPHTSGGPTRFAREAAPVLASYAASSTKQIETVINAARACEVGKDRKSVEAWLAAKKFTQQQAKAAYASAEKAQLNPRSVWGIVQGLTDVAHETGYADDRVALERKAGALLDVVAA